MKTINPYLTFNGNCEAAFNFYKSVFGGEFVDFTRFSEGPPNDQLSGEERGWLMHVALPIGEGQVLMGADFPSSMGQVTSGSNFSISISTDNDEETDRLFNGLSADGQVTMPLEKQFWGSRFGMFTDKFGISWMLSQDLSE